MLGAKRGELFLERGDVGLGQPFLILEIRGAFSFDSQLLPVVQFPSVPFRRQFYCCLQQISFEQLLKRKTISRHKLHQLEHPKEHLVDVLLTVILFELFQKVAAHVVRTHESRIERTRSAQHSK